MPATLAWATLKSFDAATYTATVQLTGSHDVYLTAVNVSTAILPAQLTAGRNCIIAIPDTLSPAELQLIAVAVASPVPAAAAMLPAHTHTATAEGGDYAWADITGFGTEPAAVSSSTSGTAGTATTASRGDHGHDLGTHAHTGATDGGQVAYASLSSIPSTFAPTVHDHTSAGAGGDYAWADITGFGTEPPATSSSTSGTAGTATTASRGDHAHDLGTHAHTGATDGGQHDAISAHSYSGGAALDVFGLSAASTPAKLTPSSNPGAAAAILATTAAGLLQLVGIGINATPVANRAVIGGPIYRERYIADSLATAGTVSSTTALGNETIYLLTVIQFNSANAVGGLGLYLIARKGTGTNVSTILAITNVAISVDAGMLVVLTNNTGGSQYYRCELLQLGV